MQESRSSGLAALFHVHSGEGRLVVLMLLHAACNGLVNIFVGTAAYTLFVLKFGASALAYTYIGVALANPLIGLVYEWLGRRLSVTNLLFVNLGGLTLTLVALRIALGITDSGVPIMMLAIFYWSVFMLTNLEFWGLAGHLFNVRQSKRLNGIIGSGEVVTRVAGGLSIPFIVRMGGSSSLLLLGAAALTGSILLLALIVSTPGVPMEEDEEASQPEIRPSRFRDLLSDPYVRLMFSMAALYNVCYWFVDQIYYNVAAARYPDETHLAGFFGLFQAVAGSVALLSSLFLTGPVLGRFGVGAGILMYPVALLFASTSLSIVSLVGWSTLIFWVAVSGNFLGEALIGSLYSPSFMVLYQPMKAERRQQVRTMGEGVVEPIAGGLAGLLLLLLNQGLHVGTTHLAVGLSLFAFIWVLCGFMLSRDYARVLTQSMSRRLLRVETLNLTEASSQNALRQGLSHPHPGVIIYAMTILKEVDPATLEASLGTLLRHPIQEVRQYALQLAEERRVSSALPIVDDLARSEPDLSVRGRALATLAVLSGDQMFDRIAPFLNCPENDLRRGAMVGLLRSGALQGVLAASQMLLDCVKSTETSERTLAARVLGEVGSDTLYLPLLGLLNDEDFSTRRAALSAAGKLKRDRLWPSVLENISVPAVQGAAMSALRKGGEQVAPLLKEAFLRPGQPRHVQLRILRLVRGIGGAAATDWLEAHLDEPDPRIRHSILTEMANRRFRASGRTIDLCGRHLRTEAGWMAWCMAVRLDVGPDEPASLLQAALDRQISEHRERIFFWLSFLFDSRAIRKVYDSLNQVSKDRRAYAFEVLDVLLPPELKSMILPLVDEVDPVERIRRLTSALPEIDLQRRSNDERLSEIVMRTEEPCGPWLRTCAIVAWAHLPRRIEPNGLPAEIVRLASTAEDLVVRETAAWAMTVGSRGLDMLEQGIATIEKVMILRKARVFSEVPDEVLCQTAFLLESIDVEAGERVVTKGDMGQSMYFIVQGKLRVHDGDVTFDHLRDGQIFGEMTVLDSQPRSASITVEAPSRLLCLEQDALYDLMSDQPEIMRGVVRMLCGTLRTRVEEINRLNRDLSGDTFTMRM